MAFKWITIEANVRDDSILRKKNDHTLETPG